MAQHVDAQLCNERTRWLRPDGFRWIRPDAARFLRPSSSLSEVYPALALKYSPSQPRVPAGNLEGGRWTRVGDGSVVSFAQPMGDVAIIDGSELPRIVVTPDTGPENVQSGVRLAGEPPAGLGGSQDQNGGQPPVIPPQMPGTREERMRFVRTAARWLASVGRFSLAASNFFEALDQVQQIKRLTDAIKTANDPAKSLIELQSRVGLPSEAGYHDHHIVNQHEGNRRKFGNASIDSSDNQVRIPVLKHLDLNGWYSRPNKDFGGLSPTEYLRDKDWDEQTRVGHDILRRMGILK